VKKSILGNKVIEVKGNSQDNRFSVEAHIEADVFGRYIQMSEKGLGNKCYKNKKMGRTIGGEMDLLKCHI
jgi:hypothetical protein